MKTDAEIRVQGVAALTKSLGTIEAERFIALILRERFDYTKWRRDLFEEASIEETSHAASSRKAEAEGIHDESPARADSEDEKRPEPQP